MLIKVVNCNFTPSKTNKIQTKKHNCCIRSLSIPNLLCDLLTLSKHTFVVAENVQNVAAEQSVVVVGGFLCDVRYVLHHGQNRTAGRSDKRTFVSEMPSAHVSANKTTWLQHDSAVSMQILNKLLTFVLTV